METRQYKGIEANKEELASQLRELLDNNGYQVITRLEPTATIIQSATPSSAIRDLTGLSNALTVKIVQDFADTRVTLGSQKWTSKVISIGVGLIITLISHGILFPAIAPGSIGAYKQYQITQKAWAAVEAHMARQSGGNVSGTFLT